jgi:hypothetical protein
MLYAPFAKNSPASASKTGLQGFSDGERRNTKIGCEADCY